ncbi:cobalt-precorrin-6A reductase [Rhizobium tubonense]|uniref:Cobalt-precorrin-6A reductase n=1 Tax=Rhizobium tubonense TaxID=484088 RepID=A0A2W4F668_9HYPH|nr:cobalt-precorrin-6A reductase [Rhizobium tubonense]PZM16470.1 cobalt-precorrin-6A reductase [Rhizobium tubonense]
MGRTRILILGGTTEARALGEAIAPRFDFDVMLSLAGRTADPLPLPVPVRLGGFGGIYGLATFVKQQRIDLLIDATHPFANRISANAAAAAKIANVPVFALRRDAWTPVKGDRWQSVETVQSAVSALGQSPRRVFLAIGRQEAHAADAAPIHHYLVRSVDAVDPPLLAPDVNYLLARGPFELNGELRLLRDNRIDVIITKNSGGAATYAKIEAARLLGIEVMMVERASAADVPSVGTVEAALRHIDHLVAAAMKRGV